jgi:hypothetical protein
VAVKNIAVLVTVLLVGISVKLTLLTAPTAEADSLPIKGVSIDVSQMHQITTNLPAQKFHDMTLVFPVFPEGD